MCILFCFFKEKTAYYRRISEWRSDVCSSDLTTTDSLRSSITTTATARLTASSTATRAIGAVASATAMAATVMAATTAIPTATTAAAIPITRRTGGIARIGPTGPTIQNGRASCRERVCQYV